jgi:predicted kinase
LNRSLLRRDQDDVSRALLDPEMLLVLSRQLKLTAEIFAVYSSEAAAIPRDVTGRRRHSEIFQNVAERYRGGAIDAFCLQPHQGPIRTPTDWYRQLGKAAQRVIHYAGHLGEARVVIEDSLFYRRAERDPAAVDANDLATADAAHRSALRRLAQLSQQLEDFMPGVDAEPFVKRAALFFGTSETPNELSIELSIDEPGADPILGMPPSRNTPGANALFEDAFVTARDHRLVALKTSHGIPFDNGRALLDGPSGVLDGLWDTEKIRSAQRRLGNIATYKTPTVTAAVASQYSTLENIVEADQRGSAEAGRQPAPLRRVETASRESSGFGMELPTPSSDHSSPPTPGAGNIYTD